MKNMKMDVKALTGLMILAFIYLVAQIAISLLGRI